MGYQSDLITQAFAGCTPNHEGWVRANCIFCENRTGKQDRKKSFGLNVNSGYYSCFKCNKKGKLPGYEHIAQPLAPKPIELIGPPEGFNFIRGNHLTAKSSLSARNYLLSRGITEPAWKNLNIGYCTSGRYAYRVIVPILQESNWLGWVGRSWVSAKLPYIYPKAMSRGDILFNQEQLYIETTKPLFIVEGVFDTVPLWPDAVAVLGKPSERQRQMFLEAKRPLVACLDGDAVLESMALSWWLRLSGKQAGYIELPPQADPDEVDINWLWEQAYESIK